MSGEIFNILLVIDDYGWIWDYIARAMQKYSIHNVDVKRADTLTKHDNYDIYHFIGLSCYQPKREVIKNNLSRKIACPNCLQTYYAHKLLDKSNLETRFIQDIDFSKKRVIVGIKSFDGLNVPPDVRFVMCNAAPLYKIILEKYSYKRIFYTRGAVDDEIFVPQSKPEDFIVGWAGNFNRFEKRTWLLPRINFPMKIKADWSQKFRVRGRSQVEMADYYNSINALISVSLAEGMPNTILEAAACGLPIVSTGVGDIPNFLDKEWIIPTFPEDETVHEAIERLKSLQDDRELREQVGNQNHEKVMKDWTWRNRIKEYEAIWEKMMDEKF